MEPSEKTHALNKKISLCIGNQNVLELAQMIDDGLDVRHTNENGVSLLYLAIFTGDMPAMVRMLIGRGAQVNEDWGLGLADISGKSQNIEQVEENLTEEQTTPLKVAIEFFLHENVRALLDCGANPNHRNYPDELDPSYVFQVSDWHESEPKNPRRSTQDAKPEQFPLYDAIQYGRSAPILRSLLDHGASISHFEHVIGMPAIHYCVHQGNLEAIQVLLAVGQDPRRTEPKTKMNALTLALKLKAEEDAKNSRITPYLNMVVTIKIIETLKAWMDCQAAKEAVDAIHETLGQRRGIKP